MEKLLSVGKILNFHGIHGEVKVGYTADKKDQLSKIKEFLVIKGIETKTLNVELVRFHKNIAIIKFKEINTVNEANEYKGAYLKVPKELLEKFLEEDEFYIDDLVNTNCYDQDGNLIGQISYIANLGAEDVLAFKDKEGKEYLVPFVKDLVPEVNIKENKIVIKKLDGLLGS